MLREVAWYAPVVIEEEVNVAVKSVWFRCWGGPGRNWWRLIGFVLSSCALGSMLVTESRKGRNG